MTVVLGEGCRHIREEATLYCYCLTVCQLLLNPNSTSIIPDIAVFMHPEEEWRVI